MTSQKRVLIIDDEADIREVARVSLELVGHYEVMTARTGREGLQAAETHLPDAILLDVSMPDLDGPGTLAALRGNPSTSAIPVVFLTATTQVAERVRLNELSPSGILTKPFDPLKLSTELAATLHWE
jgi:CheY-like chemotaxis protein